MKKMCIGLLLAAMLVGVFAPGVSARSRPLWMDQLQDHADKPQGEETGWGVESTPIVPEKEPWLSHLLFSMFSFLRIPDCYQPTWNLEGSQKQEKVKNESTL